LRYGLKTLVGIERMQAPPAWLCSDEARLRLVGFTAHQVRHGVCPRGAATRQGPHPTGPLGPEALADPLVQLNLRALARVFNGGIRALAKTGVLPSKLTGIVEATDLDPPAQDEGCGPVTRPRQSTGKRGQGQELEVTVYGGTLMVLIAARTQMPWAGQVVPIHEPAVLSMRARGTQARTTLARDARRHKVVVD
jgi:hypothetical protein